MSSVAQFLRQADTLKVTLSESGKSISEQWVSRQRLEDLYKKLLLTDLEYALDKKVEQDLWNHAFKNQINLLQIQAKDKQNVKRGENQASLNLFLETASGFYLQLLQQICTTFKLDLPFRRKSAAFGVMKEKCPAKSKITTPKKSSCLYVCQHCLVHLGDIARYRQQVEQAQTYYRHAASLLPQNGQPYNQLAILEAARGNKLSTVFYYIRSLAVRHPFPVAATNLEKFYIKLTKDIGDSRGKLSLSEVVSTFLQFVALVHLSSDLNKAGGLRERLLVNMPSHVTSQSFTTSILLQIVSVTIFTLSQAQKSIGELDGEDGHYSQEEEHCLELIQGFALGLLDVLIQATPKQEHKAREFFTLPCVKVLLDWLRLNIHLLQKGQLAEMSLWNGLVKLLNSIQGAIDKESEEDLSKYEDVPLPEDCELRCFQPIEKAFISYSYSRVPVDGLPVEIQVQLRCDRILSHGKWLAQNLAGMNLMNFTVLKSGRLQFTTPNVPTRAFEPHAAGGERKSGRQNVAIQAIIQKRNEDIDPRLHVHVGEGDGKVPSRASSGQGSPKYLLGIPTSEPQFMKHGGGLKTFSNPTFPNQRFPSPSMQQDSQQQILHGKFMQSPRGIVTPPQGPQGSAGMHITHIQQKDASQTHSSSPQHMQQLPSHMSPVPPGPPAGPPPQLDPVGRVPYPYMDTFRMQSPNTRPTLPQKLAAQDNQPMTLSPAEQQQLRAALLQTPLPPQHVQNMSPSQLLQVMKLASQMMNSAQQASAQGSPIPPPGQSAPISVVPGADRAHTPPKPGQHPPGPRMPNFPLLSGAYAGMTGSPLRPSQAFGPFPNQPHAAKDNVPQHLMKPMQSMNPGIFGGFSPRTIQPPTPSMMDSRPGSSFQGHAEGTPKPDAYSQDKKDESGGVMPQPRTYSLFNSSWEVPPLAGGEPHGFNASRTGSRKSPEHDNGRGGHGSFDARYRMHDTVWAASGPSPLERLLEQQKQQRHGEPH